MRLELAGNLNISDPIILKYDFDQEFNSLQYIELGYTHFEAICIGGGGGSGGDFDTSGSGTGIRSYGGAGGGGGFHRVRGLLSALPTLCPIVVGAAGTPGVSSGTLGSVTNGGDGGHSAFNDAACRASGGKGGKRVQANSDTVTSEADGGDGGTGDTIVAGGGAVGGNAGVPSATGPGTPGSAGMDGGLNDNIGDGGGGGAGGVGKYGSGGITCNAATPGGRGSYNPGDISVYGPGGPTSDDPTTGADDIVPGLAGGAKASPLNGLPNSYGNSGEAGAVIIRLTAR